MEENIEHELYWTLTTLKLKELVLWLLSSEETMDWKKLSLEGFVVVVVVMVVVVKVMVVVQEEPEHKKYPQHSMAQYHSNHLQTNYNFRNLPRQDNYEADSVLL
jgi:hypothetical protein